MESTSNVTGSAELDLEQLIRELNAGFHSLPRQAIRAAQQHRELAIPRLIQAIVEATEHKASGVAPEGNAHFFAMFLLTEFSAKESLPAILDAMSLPGDGPYELFGEGLTECLSCVLAELASDSFETIDNLIANRSLNEYVRSQAAQTYLHFVRNGLLSREEALECLRRHLRTAIANEDAELAEGLVAELVSYAPHEALDDIQEAFRLDLVDPGMVQLKEVEQSIAEGQSGFQRELSRCRPTGFADTIEELSRWASFQEKRNSPQKQASTRWNDEEDGGEPGLGFDDRSDAPGTIRNAEQHVGRNAPCPCGSGRKYKKCCGAN